MMKNIMLNLYQLQKNRFFWMLLALSALLLILLSLYFQLVLTELPCKYCVYQRLAILLIATGFSIFIVNPLSSVIRKIGFSMTTIAIAYGFYAVITQIYWQLTISNTLFATCSIKTEFPFNLPLDQWLPILFKPQVECQESNFLLFNIPVTYWMLLIFSGYLAIIFLCALSYKWHNKLN
jgi:disulfide bond formation protein DsbB